MKTIIILYSIVKGAIVGSVVVAVVHSGVTPFLQAFIIATVSAVIGAIGMMSAAHISTRKVDEANRHLLDLKSAQGLNKRASDEPTPEGKGSDPSG